MEAQTEMRRLLWRSCVAWQCRSGHGDAKKDQRDGDNVKMTFESGELAGIELLSKDCDNDSIYD